VTVVGSSSDKKRKCIFHRQDAKNAKNSNQEKIVSSFPWFSSRSSRLRGKKAFSFSLRTGERRQCSRRPAAAYRMQAYRKFLVLSLTFLSHLPWMPDPRANEPIKSRGRLVGVGKERDRTGAKTLRKLWPRSVVARAWRMDENNAFAAIRFWLGWNCQLLGEGGMFHWRRETSHAGAGPILFAARGERKGWGLYS
jgi:hypothetical protein